MGKSAVAGNASMYCLFSLTLFFCFCHIGSLLFSFVCWPTAWVDSILMYSMFTNNIIECGFRWSWNSRSDARYNNYRNGSVNEDPISVIMPLGTLGTVSKNIITREHSGKHFPLFLHDRRCKETCLTTSQKREVKRQKKDQSSVCRLDPVNNSSPGYA
jgi:hypothetical protein